MDPDPHWFGSLVSGSVLRMRILFSTLPFLLKRVMQITPLLPRDVTSDYAKPSVKWRDISWSTSGAINLKVDRNRQIFSDIWLLKNLASRTGCAKWVINRRGWWEGLGGRIQRGEEITVFCVEWTLDKSFFQSNFFALLMKNFLKLKRNLVMLSFVFLLPAIQVSKATS